MSSVITTHLLAALVDPTVLRGGVVVIIDQLRASTTMCAALHAGATCVVPFLEPAQAVAFKAELGANSCLTGGERHGERIAGFDLANSPDEYIAAQVRGKTIAFTTTNGTKAALLAQHASNLLIGCLANRRALCDVLKAETRPIHLLCAGTRDRVTLEDVLAAGAIAASLHELGVPINQPDAREDDDSTRLAVELWKSRGGSQEDILATLRSSRGGRNLARIGLDVDIVACSRLDVYPVVPVGTSDGFKLQPAR